ncbi:MAG: YraN family protein [Candidatus Buchananbacteria bacterium]|nr:YraN family protein [Candidatus Buchananbacteria bacterium]
MLKDNRQRLTLGAHGEALAARFLVEQGYQILQRNFRTRYGEVDIIAKAPDNLIIFCEVKTRRGHTFGYPELAVTKTKHQHLIRAAQSYLEQHQLNNFWRIDIIGIEFVGREIEPEIRWFKDVGHE